MSKQTESGSNAKELRNKYSGIDKARCQTIPVKAIDADTSLLSVQASINKLSRPLEAPSGLKFEDLFELGEIQKIQDAFALATGVASIITTADGVPITKPSNFCRLCNDIIRKTEQGLKNCVHSDAVIGRSNSSGPIMQPCLSGGLWDGGASISVGDVHVANWLIGQVRNDQQDDKAMLAYAQEIGADKEAFSEALKEVTVMSTERFASVCDALFLMANLMSNIAYQNLQQGRLIVQLERAEQSLLNAHAELEQRVESRTKELKHSLDDLRQAQKQLIESEKMAALGGLVAGVSHEINTPLGICVTSASMLQDNISNLASALKSDAPQRSKVEAHLHDAMEALVPLSHNLDSAVALIQSFKQVAVDQCCDEHFNFDLMGYLKTIKSSLDPMLRKQSIRLNIEGPESLMINGYPGVISQILTNLVKNSLDHGFDAVGGGDIAIQVQQQEGQVEIDYEDNGRGIGTDHLPKIFDPFYTTRRGQGGTGLGLHIVYNLVSQKLKGDIRCVSEGHEGAMFQITFPAVIEAS